MGRRRQASSRRVLALNTVCPYYTMFPLDFPLKRLARARRADWVLDPFCGRGTTVFAARLKGVGSVGIDSNPIASAIAAAKLTKTEPEDIIKLTKGILDSDVEPIEAPKGEFWEMCFSQETLRDICTIRNYLLRSCNSDSEVALRAVMLGILHGPKHKTVPTYISNQMPRTYATKPDAAIRYWKKNGLTKPPAVNVANAVSRRARFTFGELPLAARGEIHFGDARNTEDLIPEEREFSWVITSPPYFGMRTYRPDQWLRNWFLGGAPRVDYDQNGQLPHQVDTFADELAAVWRAITKRCRPGARLIVRFGSLPSLPVDARELLRLSLERASSGWRMTKCTDAGSSSDGKRQSQQFGRCTSDAISEIDAYARFGGVVVFTPEELPELRRTIRDATVRDRGLLDDLRSEIRALSSEGSDYQT